MNSGVGTASWDGLGADFGGAATTVGADVEVGAGGLDAGGAGVAVSVASGGAPAGVTVVLSRAGAGDTRLLIVPIRISSARIASGTASRGCRRPQARGGRNTPAAGPARRTAPGGLPPATRPSIQNCQPDGAGPHAGSGSHPGGGVQPCGGGGQFGGACQRVPRRRVLMPASIRLLQAERHGLPRLRHWHSPDQAGPRQVRNGRVPAPFSFKGEEPARG